MSDPSIINMSDLQYERQSHGNTFEADVAPVGISIGAKKLGYSIDTLAPGKKSCPYHFHYINEEMFYILEGAGTLRCNGKEYPVQSGDFICIPAGIEFPHQIINTSNAILRYLSVSTMEHPDVIEYPDSNKYAIFVGMAPGGKEEEGAFCRVVKRNSIVDYWEDES